MKEIFELVSKNNKIQALVQRGLVSKPERVHHDRFGTVLAPVLDKIDYDEKKLLDKEDLPLTLPLIKFCIADDV
jgi:hypothetical protein